MTKQRPSHPLDQDITEAIEPHIANTESLINTIDQLKELLHPNKHDQLEYEVWKSIDAVSMTTHDLRDAIAKVNKKLRKKVYG